MDISNINGPNAYTANQSATPPVDSALLENQNRSSAKTDLDQETTRAAQQAFKVNITQEAQDLLAAEETPPPVPAGPDQNVRSDQALEPDQSQAATQEARQIVNIIA